MTGTTSAAPAMRTATSSQSMRPPVRGLEAAGAPTIIQPAFRLTHSTSTTTPATSATSSRAGAAGGRSRSSV